MLLTFDSSLDIEPGTYHKKWFVPKLKSEKQSVEKIFLDYIVENHYL